MNGVAATPSDGDALWEGEHDRRQNVRRAGSNLSARSDVDSATAGTLGHRWPSQRRRMLVA
jgi:hypothetical protein